VLKYLPFFWRKLPWNWIASAHLSLPLDMFCPRLNPWCIKCSWKTPGQYSSIQATYELRDLRSPLQCCWSFECCGTLRCVNSSRRFERRILHLYLMSREGCSCTGTGHSSVTHGCL
jgi:hypothetical protein